ncbi:DUF262 domain-containing protein [Chitinophaga sp. RCC_12]|uniref:GmrSD restriction endonuclease domain-containing protein n=1 Tax=Chitinophaga sp. RCC_12 TaxID=3239226 RepID=UPI00352379B9
MSKVNLDALIRREDLEVREEKYQSVTAVHSVTIAALKKGDFFFESLRKPDFQRETCEWTPEKVFNLVQSFTSGDLIPAIILWKGDGNTFVIDGAHRLSALIAWVCNDYGDKILSNTFFGQSISTAQIKFADEARKLIENEIGSYQEITWAAENPNVADTKKLAIARRLSSQPIHLQWVPGDAVNAEKSFFKINEAASPLDTTEKRLLNARNKPNAIASRAIMRAGSGHKYWAKFSSENQKIIEDISKEISDWLFTPQLDGPVKTLDIPLAGKNYSAQTMELILNIVNFSNGIKLVDSSKIKKSKDFPENDIKEESSDGQETIQYLQNTKKMLANITGTQSSSLGLHPAIYFYSLQGRYQITAFLAVLYLVKDYENRKQITYFTQVRRLFEEFLWEHKGIVNQATTKWGSAAKGYVNLSKLFDFIITNLRENKTKEEILKLLDEHEEYNFYKPSIKELDPKYRKTFSTESKNEVFMKQGVANALKCGICQGYLHKNSIQIDHRQAIEDGGIGNAENGQVTHPYCNSIKKKLIEIGFVTE